MTSEIDGLQERVDAIRATGDGELAGRAWRALSKVLFEFTREKKRIRKFPIMTSATHLATEKRLPASNAAARPRSVDDGADLFDDAHKRNGKWHGGYD